MSSRCSNRITARAANTPRAIRSVQDHARSGRIGADLAGGLNQVEWSTIRAGYLKFHHRWRPQGPPVDTLALFARPGAKPEPVERLWVAVTAWGARVGGRHPRMGSEPAAAVGPLFDRMTAQFLGRAASRVEETRPEGARPCAQSCASSRHRGGLILPRDRGPFCQAPQESRRVPPSRL